MTKSNDPAYKYIPRSVGDDDAAGVGGTSVTPTGSPNHGIFTSVAYFLAWAIAILGTIGGLLALGASTRSPYGMGSGMSMALPIILSSWATASILGMLAEISRKLTK